MSAPGEVPSPLPRRAMLVVGASVFAISVVSHFRTPLLPEIGAELLMGAGQLGLVTTMFATGRLLTDLPAGELVDRLGARRTFIVAGAALAAGGTVFALATLPGWIYLAAALVGVGSALANTTGMTYFSTVAALHQRARSMAVFSASLLGGQALGPMLGGLLGDLAGWRVAMSVAAALGVLLGAVGLATRTGGTGATKKAAHGQQERAVAALEPIQRLALYAIPFSGMFMLGSLPQTLIPIIGAQSLGLTTGLVGLALGLGGLCRMVASPVGGWLADRSGRKAVLIPALFAQAGSVVVLAIAVTPWLWLLAIVLISLFSFTGVIAATILGDLGGRRMGRRLGSYRFIGDIGLLVGPAVTGWLFEVAGQATAVSVVAVLLVVVAALAALALPETGVRST